jgi:hypothetical protein
LAGSCSVDFEMWRQGRHGVWWEDQIQRRSGASWFLIWTGWWGGTDGGAMTSR